ncbi:MAG: Rrf2 family transcriptional regulator [Candidatus Hydrogenedentes bacterium]|nr:Rrf2 family transcriptional regulator [Candidatus Hydrogenedentota bacterium]
MLQPYSKKCVYAFRALAYVAAIHSVGRFQAGTLCKEAGVPEPFTRKVLHKLVVGGLLNAHRGPGGGYSLARPPERITLWEIVSLVDVGHNNGRCIMGFGNCGSSVQCPIHEATARCATSFSNQLGEVTLAELTSSVALREKTLIRPVSIVGMQRNPKRTQTEKGRDRTNGDH